MKSKHVYREPVGDFSNAKPLTLTRPLLPAAHEILPYLQEMIESGWVTNNGKYVQSLERKLAVFLGASEVSVVTNGTVGLDLAVKSFVPDGGEIITTAYSFPATYHVLLNNPKIKPVFVDIDDDYGLDAELIEEQITPDTRAILPVHTYGYPCNGGRIDEIAKKHGIGVIYDAAHAFGVTIDGKGISTWGDLSVFSFHATKVFNTLEGGCIASGADGQNLTDTIRMLRNFGIIDEDNVGLYGINGKMDEMRAIFGLLTLDLVEGAIQRRKRIVEGYLSYFSDLDVADVSIRHEMYMKRNIRLNYSYFPILIRPSGEFTRDVVHGHLRSKGIVVRKYFYPTITNSPLYSGLYDPDRLRRSHYASLNALCLPVHHNMTDEDFDRVISEFEWIYRKYH